MELLNYITRGKHSVSGRVKVLFCCHPEDFEKYFHTITKKIHQYVDCAIYYRECLEEDIFACLQEYEALLSEMQPD